VRIASVLVAAVLAGCSPSPEPAVGPSPTTSPTGTVRPPTEYFDLTQEDALDYLHDLDVRVAEAIRTRDTSDFDDLFIDGSPAELRARAAIGRARSQGYVDRTAYRVRETEVLSITATRAVFRQIRLVLPCRVSEEGEAVTPDPVIVLQTVRRFMDLEELNWRLARDVVEASRPTGSRAPCP
jgi:hypothetical protein